MPYGDGTGPSGQGPMTGRGRGPCGRGYGPSGGYGAGYGRGFGRGRGFGFGRGCGFGRAYYGNYGYDSPYQGPVVLTKEEEKQILEEELKAVEAEKAAIEKKLKEMK